MSNDHTLIPLAQKLPSTDDAELAPPPWMQKAAVHTEPLSKVLDQSRMIDDPLAEPAVRAEIDAAIAIAKEEARRETEKEATALFERLAEAIAQIEETSRGAFRLQASEVVELGLTVATAIIGRELAVDKDAISELVDRCLNGIVDTATIVVKLNPADLTIVESTDCDRQVALVSDASLARGECIIETPEQLVDARIASRVETLRGELVKLLEGATC